ncbi:DUF3536 domain-containing protein [bacterium]|nr:DUF3536 domain-containing protein [bacterium]MCP5462468.1 DUF3536 domain-containing protein [bacterium]
MKNKFVIVHGHFYQPPRENPWTDEIERQDSARPFHNWNERITAECYTPNAASRILNEQGLLNSISNNYKYFSFNFGPTLMHWIRKNVPETYKKIIEADHESLISNHGHGNAIAQVFNHVIMPLASDDDKRTQIEWAITDFEFHFNRKPESIWLAETAIDLKTIRILLEYDFKFLILSPYQAQRIKGFNSNTWIDVSTGNIDTRVPYRIFNKDEKGTLVNDKYIDVFFYHPHLSSSVGFEHLLTDSVRFADKIQDVFDHWLTSPQAAIVATDGESYGHHEKYGDMCFAALINREIPNRGLNITNFGRYLEICPPLFEVELKSGPKNEGTAWSCAHGVGRWYRDCTCSDGGQYGWNQKWRGPLRESFEFLRREIEALHDQHLKNHVHNLQSLRNDYLSVLLHPETKDDFLKRHLLNPATKEYEVQVFKLLEAFYFSQLTFTSCAWFFADVSGLEPVQNLKYAARAIEIIQEFSSHSIEQQFFGLLEKAESNIAELKNARKVFEKYVKPCILREEIIIGNYAIQNYILKEDQDRHIFHYAVHSILYEKKIEAPTSVFKGMVKLTNNRTFDTHDYIYYLFIPSYKNIRCYILPSDVNLEFNVSPLTTVEAEIAEMASNKFFGLKDLIGDDRNRLIELALKEEMQRLDKTFQTIYEKNIDLLETLSLYDLDLPNVLKEICGYWLTNLINKDLKALRQKSSIAKVSGDYQNVRNLFGYGKRLGLHIKPAFIEKDFNEIILSKLHDLSQKLDLELTKSTLEFISLAYEMNLKLDFFHIQNMLYKLLSDIIVYLEPERNFKTSLECIKTLLRIAQKFGFNIQKFASEIGIESSTL